MVSGVGIERSLGVGGLREPSVGDCVRTVPSRDSRWAADYALRLTLTDSCAVLVAVAVAYVVRFNLDDGVPEVSGAFSPSYLVVSLVLMVAWLVALSGGRTRDRRVIGIGPEEYSRVFAVTWRLFATVAVVAFLLRMEIGRGYLAIAAPFGLGMLLLGRYVSRQWLHRQRDRGQCQMGILVIGHRGTAATLIRQLHANPRAGHVVIGVCVPSGEVDAGETLLGVPVLGAMDHAAEVAEQIGAVAVAVTGADAITADIVRRLGWDLEGKGIDLTLTLALTDVAGPRVLMRPVNGLPLVYVDEPHFSGPKYAVKTVFDICGAVFATLILSPLLIAIAIGVKTTSRGPIFYTQERVGRAGRSFKMIKFRSMIDGSDVQTSALSGRDQGNGVLFKIRRDPRVTPIGRLLRRWSLDELPQLVNVLNGSMALVGPRPPLQQEVDRYAPPVQRRLLVKPGMTGLWQVSGRSDLSWEESVRLDLAYVENWTGFGDLIIIARTVRVVVSGRGAY